MRLIKTLLTGCLLFLFAVVYISCKKTDSLSVPGKEPTEITSKFFDGYRSSGPTEQKLVNYFKRRNEKTHFVVETVSRIGYPHWDKAIVTTKLNPSKRGNDSLQTYYVPFVQDPDSSVNAVMVVKISGADTTFFYRQSWEYTGMENDSTNAGNEAATFATFFMTLDQAVFGWRKFKILDSTLFRHDNHRAEYVKFDSIPFTPVNNLLTTVVLCQDMQISFNNCPNPGQCAGPGGSCDRCLQYCTSSISYEYCWEGVVDAPGTSGGGTGTGGGGGDGDGDTPPPCGSVENRQRIPCPPPGGGWIPAEDVGYVAPSSIVSVSTSEITDQCLLDILQPINDNEMLDYLLRAYNENGLPNVSGTTRKHQIYYHIDNSLVDNNGFPTPASSAVTTLANGTKKIDVYLNTTFSPVQLTNGFQQ